MRVISQHTARTVGELIEALRQLPPDLPVESGTLSGIQVTQWDGSQNTPFADYHDWVEIEGHDFGDDDQ
jgi:hypothetical protein